MLTKRRIRRIHGSLCGLAALLALPWAACSQREAELAPAGALTRDTTAADVAELPVTAIESAADVAGADGTAVDATAPEGPVDAAADTTALGDAVSDAVASADTAAADQQALPDVSPADADAAMAELPDSVAWEGGTDADIKETSTKGSICCKDAADCAPIGACAMACVANKCQTVIPDCCDPAAGGNACDDFISVTWDFCGADEGGGFVCNHLCMSSDCVENGACDDGNPCTAEYCNYNNSGGSGTCPVCVYAPIAGCCTNSTDCDDCNPCTQDVCNYTQLKCSHTPTPGCM